MAARACSPTHFPGPSSGCRRRKAGQTPPTRPHAAHTLLLAALCGALVHCETGAVATDRAAPSPVPPGPATAGDPIAAAPVTSTSVRAIRWPSAADLDPAARSGLDERARTAVERSPVPVLVPPAERWLTPATIMTGEHWFAYAATQDGLTVSIRGTRLAHHYPRVAPVSGDHRVRGAEAFVSENRRIWTVSWLEHGAAYGLDLECASGADPRCADESFAIHLTEQLAYVGGRQAQLAGGAQ